MLAIIDIVVGMMPYCVTITSEVVKTAGPTINGVPRGTAPSSLLGTRLFLTGLITSVIARQKSIAPPAIIKSPIVIPSSLKTSFPTRIKPTATPEAVSIDWIMTFAFSLFSILSVRETNNGSTPIASTATNSGMNDKKMFFSIKSPVLSQ